MRNRVVLNDTPGCMALVKAADVCCLYTAANVSKKSLLSGIPAFASLHSILCLL